MKYLNWRVGVFLAFGLTVALPGQAQITVPLNNDTGTQLRIVGDRIEILGGSFSGDNANLFHSFEQFNLNQNQIADFLANPTTQNILGRVMGGDPSLINGLLQVSNSNANLYLMNPAGIVFGAGARLNVGGDFFATTATGIGFNNNWFNAFGDNSYSDLIGTPNQFAFDLTEAGAIINNGDLQVNTHQNLTLLGGTVINTGNLTAPAGEITITAVPNSSLVRISHADSLLSLEIEPPRNTQGTVTNFTALDLPELLTATPDNFSLNLNTTSDGNIQLDNTIIPNETGVAIASGNLDVSGTTGGSLNVLGNKVAVISGNLNASGENSGGNIRIGGDFQGQGLIPNAVITIVDENSLINSNAGQIGDGGRTIVWADRTTKFDGTVTATGGQILGNGGFIEISGKENLSFDGTVNVSANNGSLGTILFDPRDIIIGTDTTDDAQLDQDIPNPGDLQGRIFADDGGTTTDFRISATKLESLAGAGVGNIVLQASRNINLVTDLIIEIDNLTLIAGNNFNGTGRNITLPGGNLGISANNITIGEINTSSTGGSGGNVALNATGNVTTGNIDTSVGSSISFVLNGGEVEIIAGGSITTGSINTSAVSSFFTMGTSTIQGGGVTLKAGSQPGSNITFSSITTTAEEINTISTATVSSGDVEILANGLVRGTDVNFNSNTIDTRAISNSLNTTNNSGDVTIQHDGGFGNVPFVVGDSAVASDSNRNGTFGGINAGNGTPLLSGTFPVAPNGDTSNPQPDITIISVNSPPVVPAFEPIYIDPQSGQSSITFSFNQLATQVSDVDLDTNSITSANNAFTIFINEITPEGTLKLIRNNTEIVLSPGSSLVLQPGDVLVYEPEANFTGDVNIFRLGADDNAAIAPPQAVSITTRRPGSSNTVNFDPKDIELIDRYSSLGEPVFIENEPVLSNERDRLVTIEAEYSQDYTDYFGLPGAEIVSLDEAREILRSIEEATGEKPALIYVSFTPTNLENITSETEREKSNRGIVNQEFGRFSNNGLGEIVQTPTPSNRSKNPNDPLELLLITANEPPIRVPVRGVTRAQMMAVAEDFRRTVTTASRPTAYQEPAQQLYEWIITPLKAEMERQEITNIAFIMASNLRSLPVAALYDGEEFLIEQYSVGLMPSLSLTDTRYQDVKNLSVLAMGAENFVQLQPLPAVPLELNIVTEKLWSGEAFFNEEFTIQNLQGARSQTPHGIVHLATHAEFNPGTPENSYIQFWGDSQLSLNRLRELGLNNPPVELLVLSACRTALGSETAELGFTGLAVQAGVKSGLGSLWYVSDAGTLALMSAFYEALQSAPIKAEAVRQAQLALLRGEVRFEQGALISRGLVVPLTANFTRDTNRGLTHPYYWSGFTLVGSPW